MGDLPKTFERLRRRREDSARSEKGAWTSISSEREATRVFRFRLNRKDSRILCFVAFSSRELVPTSLENALGRASAQTRSGERFKWRRKVSEHSNSRRQ